MSRTYLLNGGRSGIGASTARVLHPLQRIGAPDDEAALVAFLLSDASKFMTGQILRLDGGLSSVRTF